MESHEILGVLSPTDYPPGHVDYIEGEIPTRCLFTRFFPEQEGKFFGRPAWLGLDLPNDVKQSLTCRNCANEIPLTFLGQINSTAEGDSFYRFVYLFMCINCNSDFRAIRGYLSRSNPLYYPSCLNMDLWGQGHTSIANSYYQFTSDRPQSLMEVEPEDLTEEARRMMIIDPEATKMGLCRICLLPGGAMEVVDETDEHMGLATGDRVHCRCLRRAQVEKDLSLTSYDSVPIGLALNNELELIGRQRDYNIFKQALPNLGFAEEQELLDEKNQAMTAEQAKELDEAMAQDDEEAECKELYNAELRLKDDDGLIPVVRYEPGSGQVFWMTAHGSLRPKAEINRIPVQWAGEIQNEDGTSECIEIPKCQYCGSERKFEAQIYSSICTYAQRELDIGTVVIFTCVNDCVANSNGTSGYVQGYNIEAVYVQFDDTAVQHQIRPRLYH